MMKKVLGSLLLFGCVAIGWQFWLLAQQNPAAQTVSGTGNSRGPSVPNAFFAVSVLGNCAGNICDPSGEFPLAGGISLGTLGKVGFTGWNYVEPSCDGGIDPSSSCYHWTQLYPWVNYAQVHGLKLVYDLDQVPGWMCSQSPYCTVLPSNLTLVSNFATALATQFKGQIQYYETLNEVDNVAPYGWSGTCADLVLLHNTLRDAIKAADPNAVVGAPNVTGYSTVGSACDSSPVNAGTNSVLWVQNFLQTHDRNGSLPRVDTVGIHTYQIAEPAFDNVAQRFLDQYNQLRSVMTAAGIPMSAPLLVTEGSFGPYSNGNCGASISSTACLTSAQQPAYVGRWLVLGASTWADGGGALPSWYGYDFTYGTLNGAYGMNPQNASAYGQMETWINGATFSQQCHSGTPSTVFVCDFTNGLGQQSEIIFNDNNGSTDSYTVPGWATTYQPLLGSAQAISVGSVTVGDTPILLSD